MISTRVSKKQKQQLDELDAIWDSMSTAEGLLYIRSILGEDGYWAYLNAATSNTKLDLIVIDDDDDVAMAR